MISMLVALVVAAAIPAAAQEEPVPPEAAEPATEVPPEAERVEPSEPEPPPEPTLAELRAVWAKQPAEDVLTEARLRIETRDFAAADARLDFLIDSTDAPIAWFERGRSLELQERYREALDAYAATLSRTEDPLLVRDIWYRQAIALNDLRHHNEARVIAKKLRKLDVLDDSAIPVVDLELGVAEAGMGKKKGSKRVIAALADLDAQGDAHAWARSRARFALTRQVLDDALDIPLTGDKKAARNLVKRADALKAAEQQVIAIAKTGEPEYALAGILALGDAYIALHDDLIAAPPPRKLTEEQANLYKQQVAERAAILREKAYRFYDEGVGFAVRVQWHGGITERMKRRRDALAMQVGT
jgi:tetratricopeptide (TPR) repeat protein